MKNRCMRAKIQFHFNGPTRPLFLLAAILAIAIAGSAQSRTEVNRFDGLKYVWVPPGTFQMGCSPADSECGKNETPEHAVTITKGFWIGQTLVTQRAFK